MNNLWQATLTYILAAKDTIVSTVIKSIIYALDIFSNAINLHDIHFKRKNKRKKYCQHCKKPKKISCGLLINISLYWKIATDFIPLLASSHTHTHVINKHAWDKCILIVSNPLIVQKLIKINWMLNESAYIIPWSSSTNQNDLNNGAHFVVLLLCVGLFNLSTNESFLSFQVGLKMFIKKAF